MAVRSRCTPVECDHGRLVSVVGRSKAAHAVVTVAARGAAAVIRMSPVGAGLDVASQVTGKTVGLCVGGDVLGGIDVNGTLRYVSTPSGQAGITASAGGGVGFRSASGPWSGRQ